MESLQSLESSLHKARLKELSVKFERLGFQKVSSGVNRVLKGEPLSESDQLTKALFKTAAYRLCAPV